MLDAVQELGTGKTDSYVQAFIYVNGHQSNDPRQSRQPGDVLLIDEKKGILAAFSKSGVVKTARIDNPAALRAYIQSEKFKDVNRNDPSFSGSE